MCLTVGFLLYDLYFDIAWHFSPQNHKIVYLVMAVLRVHIVFAVISTSFPGLSNLPCALCIPSSTHFFWKHKSFTPLSYKVKL